MGEEVLPEKPKTSLETKLFMVIMTVGFTSITWGLVKLVNMDTRVTVMESTRFSPNDGLEMSKVQMQLAQQLNQNSLLIAKLAEKVAENKADILEMQYKGE